LGRQLKLLACPQFTDANNHPKCLPANNQRRVLICGDDWGAYDSSGPEDGIIHTCDFDLTMREWQSYFDRDLTSVFDVYTTNYTFLGQRSSFYDKTNVHKFYAENATDWTSRCAYDRFTWYHDWVYIPGTWSGLLLAGLAVAFCFAGAWYGCCRCRKHIAATPPPGSQSQPARVGESLAVQPSSSQHIAVVFGGQQEQQAARATATTATTTTLYHQTSPDIAKIIVQSQTMLRGSPQCLAGAGIYFAVSVPDTFRKARRLGVVLAADVDLGRVKSVGSQGDRSITFTKLRHQGYDSIRIDGLASGVEYVVYNCRQVNNIRLISP
jgi:hypothetical protein